MAVVQKVFDLDIQNIIYCSFCNIKFNKLNTEDVKFHKKIHKAHFKGFEKVRPGIYKKKDIFAYSPNKKYHNFEVWIRLKKFQGKHFIYEQSTDYTEKMKLWKYQLISYFKTNVESFKASF